jgi:hypothetical protein
VSQKARRHERARTRTHTHTHTYIYIYIYIYIYPCVAAISQSSDYDTRFECKGTRFISAQDK